MSVTEETFQPEMSPSKALVSKNMLAMSVTPETSQPERSPSKVRAPENMLFMSVTPERSGASVASYIMSEAPAKADAIEVHRLEPHWSIETSLYASP